MSRTNTQGLTEDVPLVEFMYLVEDVPLVELMYFVITRMSGKSYRLCFCAGVTSIER